MSAYESVSSKNPWGYKEGDIFVYDPSKLASVPQWRIKEQLYSRPLKLSWLSDCSYRNNWDNASCQVRFMTKKGVFSERAVYVQILDLVKVASQPNATDVASMITDAFESVGETVIATKKRSAVRVAKLKIEDPEYDPR